MQKYKSEHVANTQPKHEMHPVGYHSNVFTEIIMEHAKDEVEKKRKERGKESIFSSIETLF